MIIGTGALALIALLVGFLTGHLMAGIIVAVVILILGGGVGYGGRTG